MDGTAFKNCLIELIQTKEMTKAEWDAFCKAKTEELRVKLDIPAKQRGKVISDKRLLIVFFSIIVLFGAQAFLFAQEMKVK